MSESDSTQDTPALPYGDEGSRTYKAISGIKRCMHLMFVPANGQHDRLLPFHDIRLMQLRKDGTELCIEFSGTTAILTGQNLRAVAFAIGAHLHSRVEAFDPQEHDAPQNASDAYIERITFEDPSEEEAKPLRKHELETRQRMADKTH